MYHQEQGPSKNLVSKIDIFRDSQAVSNPTALVNSCVFQLFVWFGLLLRQQQSLSTGLARQCLQANHENLARLVYRNFRVS